MIKIFLSSHYLFYIILTVTKTSRTDNDTEVRECELLKLNKDLRLTTNNIFQMLHLNDSIKDTYVMKQLMTINKHLKQLEENKLQTYEEISGASKMDNTNFTFDRVNAVSLAINEILNLDGDSELTKPSESRVKMKQETSFEHHKVPGESLEFVKDFIQKIDKLTLADIIGPYNKSEEHQIENSMIELLKKKKTYNLKKWTPSNYSNEDLSQEFHPNNTRRLFHGTRTTIQKYPFMVSVHIQRVFVCSGCIISKNMIITAAACLQIAHKNTIATEKHQLGVRVASNYANKSGILLDIMDIHFHPNFDSEHLKHNIALARVAKLMSIKNKKVRRIPLATMETWLPKTGITIRMLGWGDMEFEDINQDVPLSLTRLSVYDLEDCLEIYSGTFITDNNFCMAYTDRGGGACNWDIGGPAVVSGVLAGIVSFGPPICGTSGAPTVFTDVTKYLTWINSIVGKTLTHSQYLAAVFFLSITLLVQ